MRTPRSTFGIRTSRNTTGVYATVTGRLVLGPAAQRGTWDSVMSAARGRRLTLDLWNVEQIDAAGIGLLVTLAVEAARVGGSVFIAAAHQRTWRLLRVMGVDTRFTRVHRSGSANERPPGAHIDDDAARGTPGDCAGVACSRRPAGRRSTSARARAVRTALAAVVVTLITACGPTSPSAAEAAFTVDVAGEQFTLKLTDPDAISAAEDSLHGRSTRFPLGPLRAGDGGFNTPWSWHLDPAETRFVEVAIEVCDGRPSYVEQHRGDYPVYCPWGARVVGRR